MVEERNESASGGVLWNGRNGPNRLAFRLGGGRVFFETMTRFRFKGVHKIDPITESNHRNN